MLNINEIYNQSIKVMRSIVEDIRFGRNLYLKPVEMCADQICKYLNDEAEILTLLNNTRNKHPYMYSHPVNVALIAYVIGKWMNLDYSKLENLVRAGLLHDIGKAKIKDSLLNKKEPLTQEDLGILKAHPILGYKIVNSVNMFNPQVLQGILFHHERMDGTGYPMGLMGERINIYSRILAIADCYDAITATKPYREGRSPLKALDEIRNTGLSNNQLDPYICKSFISNMIQFYTGREIRLSNEQIGNIVRINFIAIAKPTICCDNEYHDLREENELEIIEIH